MFNFLLSSAHVVHINQSYETLLFVIHMFADLLEGLCQSRMLNEILYRCEY
jgi:hypothetical protein